MKVLTGFSIDVRQVDYIIVWTLSGFRHSNNLVNIQKTPHLFAIRNTY